MKIEIGKTTFIIDTTKFTKRVRKSEIIGKELYKGANFYRAMEIKNNLDIENEGSSKKIIDKLAKNKLIPKNNNQHLLWNLWIIHQRISTNPKITILNLRSLYDMMWFNIESKDKMDKNEYPWRTKIGNISSGQKNFNTLKPKYLNSTMNDLFSFINSDSLNELLDYKSLIIMFWFIYAHPFYDYNGKMSRILSTWFLNNHQYYFSSMQFSLVFKCMKAKFFDDLKKIRLDEQKGIMQFNITVMIEKWRSWLIEGVLAYCSYVIFSNNRGIKITDTKSTIYSVIAICSKFSKQSKFTQKDIEKIINFEYDPKYLNKVLTKMAEEGYIQKLKQSKSPVYFIKQV